MSNSESDSENYSYDNDADDAYDRTDDEPYDENILDFDNTDGIDYDPYDENTLDFDEINGDYDLSSDDTCRVTSIIDHIYENYMGTNDNTSLVNITSNCSSRVAMNVNTQSSTNTKLPNTFVSDSISTYLRMEPLIREKPDSKNFHCLFASAGDDSEGKSLSIPELYVGNLRSNTTQKELNTWFVKQGYIVSHINLKNNKKNTCYAFVRFDSIKTANQVLFDFESKRKVFLLNGKQLYIKQKQNKSAKPPQNTTNTMIHDDEICESMKIKDIYYGTIICNADMKNMKIENSVAKNHEDYGIIAHCLMDELNVNFYLKFDIKKKKLSISGRLHVDHDSNSDSDSDNMFSIYHDDSDQLDFEWDFSDLKTRKITPVLVDQNKSFLLFEIKRPPTILCTENRNYGPMERSYERRLPGWRAIGQANTWLFKLSAEDLRHDYEKLFKILRRHNLCRKEFSEHNIISLINSKESARQNLESIVLMSNDEWMKTVQSKLHDFLTRRWPSYPFETKFEIMKLISKHIITVQDLVPDEKAESILESCSINTFIALTDKIEELAPRWFASSYDNEDEDWDNKLEQNQEQIERDKSSITRNADAVSISTDNQSIPKHVRSCATGRFVNTTNTKVTCSDMVIESSNSSRKTNSLGTFSRLLILAFKELLKKSQLCKNTTTGTFMTKLELRTANADPFLTYKIYITPSNILYEGPYREEKCAVTRQFVKHQDRFLRVVFRDEDYRVLHDYKDNMTKMYERIKKALIEGIVICDRHYEFLAFSSSQLREHSCWMFAAADDGTTVDSIREWIGDFRDVHPVAKFAARLGQSFSTSIRGIKLERHQWKKISDFTQSENICGHTREHCFTDGIGIISKKFAKRLAQEINLPESVCPSAFQIRCGGFKGMVCLDIANKISADDICVYFRESMKKFDANEFSIDVVRTSLHPTVAYLNRQIILLLSSLGIPDKSFKSLQTSMLRKLKELARGTKNTCEAIKALKEFGNNDCHAFLIAYIKSLKEERDPFVQQLIFALQASMIKQLRTKARIHVPDSWCLLGVIDETRTLNYGEVFIQLDNSHQEKVDLVQEIIKGPVIVTRNPCFHPGDIRRLQAVDIPALHELKNVIVFPMQGPRPHPMEMSGGDLDGDTFWISCHPDLIFSENQEPYDYQEQEDEAKQQTHSQANNPHTIEDVCNFFGEYIAADNLGIIANSHLALADQLVHGVKNDACLKLARMHSVAVDFAKKGVNAPRLTRDLRPSKYPHYMGKKDKECYKASTVIGILYDEVKDYDTNLYYYQEKDISTTSSFPYQSFLINGSNQYKEEAHIIKNDYESDLKRLMRQYGIKHEAEIVSGYILEFTSKQYAKETKLFELRNEIKHAYKVIQEKYLHLFWQQFYQTKNESEDEQVKWSEVAKKLRWKNQLTLFEFYDKMTLLGEVKKKASAWFHVTYELWMIHVKKYQKDQHKKSDMSSDSQQAGKTKYFKQLFSFAWIVYPVLLEIFEENKQSKKSKKKRSTIDSHDVKSTKFKR